MRPGRSALCCLLLTTAALVAACINGPAPSDLSYVDSPGDPCNYQAPDPGASKTPSPAPSPAPSVSPSPVLPPGPALVALTFPVSTLPAGAGHVPVRVRVLDAGGTGVAAQTVHLSIIRGVGTLAASVGTTDAQGWFTTTLSNHAAGNFGVRATVGALTRTAMVTFVRPCTNVTFAAPVTLNANSMAYSVYAVGDLNADAAYDLAVTGNNNIIMTMLNDGQGNLTLKATAAYGDASMDGLATRMVDMTGDGISDIVTSYYSHDSIGVWTGDNAGNIIAWTNHTYINDQGPVVGDIDGDGYYDVAAATYYGNRLAVGFGGPQGLPAQALNANLVSGMHAAITNLGDFNGDGYVDIVVGNANATSNVSVLLGRGGRTFSAAQSVNIAPRTGDVVAADFNGDGADDLLTGHDANISVSLSDGTGNFAVPSTYATGFNYVSLDTADFNGDGTPDAVAGLNGGSYILVFINNGSLSPTPMQVLSGGAGPAVITADFDNDGRVDIVTLAGIATVLLRNTCQ